MKLIPRFKPFYDHREFFAALNPWSGGIEEYERQFAGKFGRDHGVMFPYGRSGQFALFKVWGLKDIEIICPAYTCVVVAHAIVLSGNIPVFVDCEEGSFNMSYDGIEKAITAKTRAIMVTHLFGYPMDVHRINDIVKKAEEKHGHKIYVVQDAAHSFGAKFNGELVTKFGDAAIFGLNISKIINCISGGMVITDDPMLDARLRDFKISNFKQRGALKSIKRFVYMVAVMFAFNKYIYRIVNWLERKGSLDRLTKYYDEETIDFPKDWDDHPLEIEARVGLVQLQKYDRIVETKQKVSRQYINELSCNDQVEMMPDLDGATYSHCVAIVPDRHELANEYFKKGIQLGELIEYSIPYMKAYAEFRSDDCPVSKYYSEHAINFPNWDGQSQ